MKNKSDYCGKEVRQHLYVVGFMAVLVLVGSYWYIKYYQKGKGIAFPVGDAGPLAASPDAMALAQPMAGQPSLPPQLEAPLFQQGAGQTSP
ncbi:MAG: hypothetical protein HQK86_12860, partial [Nitrospinae bacterium]|nr:hypothetical protein [Nitrospinota bacterium]